MIQILYRFLEVCDEVCSHYFCKDSSQKNTEVFFLVFFFISFTYWFSFSFWDGCFIDNFI